MSILFPLLLPLTWWLPSALQEAPVVEARAWELLESDIPANERITFGVLDNGLRYAWMTNVEPEQRSYLRLHVDVGSTAETDDEQGMAHFLEHMAFNGSDNYEAGTLVEWFQANGMRFGADLNASTSFTETIYKIDLPESTEERLLSGLTVLRDFAGGLLLAAEEVEAEIGVIDGEERERDSAGYRVAIESLRKQFDGTLISERIPIGVRDVRAAFTDESVRAFYERWYRPENMTLVIVGDLKDLDPVPLVEQTLGTLPVPEAPLRRAPDLGTPSFGNPFFVVHDDEIETVNLSIAHWQEYEEDPVDVATWAGRVPEILARRMVNLRLSELSRKPGTPFLGASVSAAEPFEVMDIQSIDVVAKPELWAEALAAAEQELRRALEHGFQEPELDEVRADFLHGLDEAIQREPTRSSRSFLNEILSAVDGRSVPTTAATDRDVLAPAVEATTIGSAHAALVEAWSQGRLAVTATGGADLGADGAERLRAAYESSRQVEVDPPARIVSADFAYAAPEEGGAIAETAHVEDLDITLVHFANGVLLNVKPTDFKESSISITARVAEGQLALEPGGTAVMLPLGFAGMDSFGTGAHDIDELRRITAGRQVVIPSMGAGEDHFAIGANTNAADLQLQLELICAYVSDPGWRDDTMRQRMEFIPNWYEQMTHNTQGPLIFEFLPAFHGGDMRFGVPPLEETRKVGLADLRAWVGPQLGSGPVEVSIVGDLDVDQVVEIAARTLGRLPPRRDPRSYDERREVSLVKGLHQEHEVVTAVPGERVSVFFPSTDGFDTAVRRRLHMLGVVLSDRVRQQIREKLGEAYSPSAGSSASRVFPGVGYLQIGSSADTGRAADVLAACLEVAGTLAEEGVTEDELQRLREPELKRIRDQLRQNGFWLSVLSEAQSKPERLEDMRTLISAYEAITAEELSELAGQYLEPEAASWVVVRPVAEDAGS